jgi:hypothetical protein
LISQSRGLGDVYKRQRSLATSPTVESKVQLLVLLEEYSGKLNYFINKEHIRLNQL